MLNQNLLALLDKAAAPVDPLERLRPSTKARWQDPLGYRPGAIADLEHATDDLVDVETALGDIASELGAYDPDDTRLEGFADRLRELARDISRDVAAVQETTRALEDALDQTKASAA